MSSFSPNNSLAIGIGGVTPSGYLNLYNEFVVQEGGNVGIGTNNPLSKLHVKGTSEVKQIFETDGTGDNRAEIHFLEPGSSGMIARYEGVQNNFQFIPLITGTEQSPALTIVRANGNVGIGTTDPIAKLQVEGSIRAVSNDPDFTSGGSVAGIIDKAPGDTVRIGSITGGVTPLTGDQGAVRFIVNNVDQMRIDPNGNVDIGNDNPSQGVLRLNGSGNTTLTLNPNSGAAIYANTGSSLRFGANNNSQFMVINTSGRVGIGSTIPNYKLDVVGDVNITGNFLVNGVANSVSTPWLTSGLNIYYNTGSVGIGTTNPEAILDVNGTCRIGDRDLLPVQNTTGGDLYPTKITLGNGFCPQIRVRYPNNTYTDKTYLEFYTAGFNQGTDTQPPRMVIQGATGNVGIGTNNPGSELDVIGDVRATNFIITSDERIKSNISEVDGKLALERVRLIKPSEFNFIENSKRGSTNSKVIGFIAQDVRRYVPEAVTLGTRFIPDVFSNCTIHPEDFRMVVPGRARSGKIRIMLNLERVMDLSVLRLDSDTLQYDTLSLTEEDRALLSRRDEIFVYGYEVDDFHSLNKDYLFALNFAATGEIDEKVQRLERENQVLKDTLEKILYTMKDHGMEIR